MPPNQLIPPLPAPHFPFLPFTFSSYSSISVTCPGGITVWYDPLPHNTRIPPPPSPTILPPNKFNSGPQKGKERPREIERGWLANKNKLCRLGPIAPLCLAQREKQGLHPHFSPLCLSPYPTGRTSGKNMKRKDMGGWEDMGDTNIMLFRSHLL